MSTAIYDCRETVTEERSSNSISASKEVNAGYSRLWRAAFSLSLANLCFLVVWGIAIGLAANQEMQYFEMAPPSFGFVSALLVDVFTLATVIYLLLWARRRFARFGALSTVLLSSFCAFGLLQAEGMAVQQMKWPDGVQIFVALTTLILASLSIRRVKKIVKAAVVVLSPLLPILIVNAAWLYSRPELKQLGLHRAAGKLPSITSHSRLIWIIFDELDYHLAFEARPARLQMPEFDRVRDVSIFSDHAHSPAGQTILSMPSLLTARRVVEENHRANDIALRFEGASGWHDLSAQPNIFRRLRMAGFNTAVSGWHHPYCRVLGNDLSECASAPNGTDSVAFYDAVVQQSFWSRSLSVALWEAESLPLERIVYRRSRPFWVSHSAQRTPLLSAGSAKRPGYGTANVRNRVVREQQIHAAQLISENGLRMAKDPALNLILIHAPAPHLPGIWNSRARRFTATEPSDYVDNLAFADFFLGQIRTALESTGQWNRTALLISADHPFRTRGWERTSLWSRELANVTNGHQWEYVPFILKLPGQSKLIMYHREFNTVVSADLIGDVLTGKVNQPEQAVRWLDAH
jgi:hypothetical protein